MKYYILHVFRASTPFIEKKSSGHFKDFHKMKLFTNFNVNMTLSQGGGVVNKKIKIKR